MHRYIEILKQDVVIRATSPPTTLSAGTSHAGRFTRFINAFSKKGEPHVHMVSHYTLWCNLIRQHKTLRCSPAMAAGIGKTLWSMDGVVALIDAKASAPESPRMYKLQDGI